MGSSYKKRQRAEKAKTKLKSRKLPKGLNLTKTEFKVRKIIIKDQIKQSTIVEGQRLYDLKELNSKLKHHNHNHRQDALCKVREAILVHHEKLPIHINDLIQSISSLSLDQERSIRQESFRVLSTLLDYLTPERTAPFFHILSSYLRCAMTHIHTAIQEDALLMLDILLKHVPELVAADSTRILQNFLEMISSARNDGKITGTKIQSSAAETTATSASGRALLTLAVGQKQTAMKWRARVLIRLQEMLRTLVSYKRQQMKSIKEQQRNPKTFIFNKDKAQYVNLLRRSIETNTFTFDEDVSCGFNYSTNNSTTELCSYIENLMPLLIESWMEVKPKNKRDDQYQQNMTEKKKLMEGVLPLTADAANTLNIVLDVIEHLWCLIDLYESVELGTEKELTAWFQDTYQETFANNFIQSTLFPYRMCGKITGTKTTDKKGPTKRNKQGINNDLQLLPNCLNLNISVSYLMCRFYASTDNTVTYDSVTNHRFTSAICCLERVLVDSTSIFYHSQSLQQSLMQTFRVLLLEKGKYFLHQLPDETISLMQKLLKVFLTNPVEDDNQSQEQMTIFNSKIATLLCEIIMDADLYEMFGGLEEFHHFLEYIPSLLLKKTIHETTIKAFTQLGKRQQAVFLESLSKYIPGIVTHLQSLQIIGSTNIIESKKNIINLIFWIKMFESQSEEKTNDIEDDVDQLQETNNSRKQMQSVKRNLNCEEILHDDISLTDECLLDYLKYVITIKI